MESVGNFTCILSVGADPKVEVSTLMCLNASIKRYGSVGWWARENSNLRPLPCQGSALTN